ncbi:MAG TPA: hypothetical protein VMR41_02830 [Patescibacteria group bacterium]|nr:hypothetical protein [Patescibacteria group bacterium]
MKEKSGHNEGYQMSKLSLLLSYFLVTPCIILLALVFSLFIEYQYNNPHHAASFYASSSTTVYAALPNNQVIKLIQTNIQTSDARVEIIRQFLARHSSPLEPYSNLIVNTADTYGLDYRLITAIAGQESDWCRTTPKNSYNCWGFGIYGGKVTRFQNYSEAIETVTKTLAVKYKSQGLTTPEQIMSVYNPSSKGSWANGVNTFMDELQ